MIEENPKVWRKEGGKGIKGETEVERENKDQTLLHLFSVQHMSGYEICKNVVTKPLLGQKNT